MAMLTGATVGLPAGQASTAASRATATQGAPDAHDSAALVAALTALQDAQSKLTAAQRTLATARRELVAARTADQQAQTDLDAAVFAEQRAVRDLAAVETRIDSHRTDLGRLARATYQSNGVLGEWSLVLASESPNQLADRLASLQSVASAGNAVIARLEEDRADLTNSHAHLRAARSAQEAARQAAEQALAATVVKERAARLAAQRLSAVVAVRTAALAAARQAVLEDQRLYRTMLDQSGALAQRIRTAAARLAKTSSPPHGTGRMDRPGRGVVTSPYGPRMHPILHYVKIHTGIDFAVSDGIAYAADDGVVIITEGNVAYGNMTVVDHGVVGGLHLTTLYAHQAAFGVKPGDRVRKGQPIGVIGATGYATGPHLHFEVRINGSPVDPAPFLVGAPLPPVR